MRLFVGYLNRNDVKLALNLYSYESVLVHNISTPKVVLLDRNWTMCNDKIFNQWPLADMYSDTTGLYQEIHDRIRWKSLSATSEGAKAHWDSFKMLIFSGDADGVCSTIGTQHWVYNITGQMRTTSVDVNGTTGTVEYETFNNHINGDTNSSDSSDSGTPYETLWQPWNAYGQRAGSISLLSQHLAFVTVHDAGHEVPAYQPARAMVLLGHYLTGDLYDKNSDLLHGRGSGVTKNQNPNGAGLQPVDPVISDIIVLLISLIGFLTFLMFVCRVKTTKTKFRRVMDNMDNMDSNSNGDSNGDSVTIEMGHGIYNNSSTNTNINTHTATHILKYESEESEDVK